MRYVPVVRTLLALLLVATACGDKPAPDPKQFAALDEEARCAAALPRAKRCIDELVAQQIEDLIATDSKADKEATEALTKDLRQEKSFSDEAEAIHRTNCAASSTYPDSVVACWAETNCKAFSACVVKRERASGGGHPRPPTSPSPSSPSPSGMRP